VGRPAPHSGMPRRVGCGPQREAMLRADPRLIGAAKLPDGARVTVRPACPRDAGRIQNYIRGLSPPSRYDRFLAPINELSSAELARVGGSDERQATLVAETKFAGTRIVIGEARYASDADGSTCEIALSVADAWRGRGLGPLLMDELECRARTLGVSMLVGDVLRSNTAMRTLARKAGFDTGVPADARLVRIVKNISAARVGAPCERAMASGLSMAA
jgi:acetyltransferase